MNKKGLLNFYIVAVCLFGFLSSCTTNAGDVLNESSEVVFTGYLEETKKVKTRVESSYIKGGGEYNQNFYIELYTEPEKSLFGVYTIPSGYDGRLAAKNSMEELNWQDFSTDHVFYGWTIPWNQNYYDVEGLNAKRFQIKFEDSGEEEFYNNKNNAQYETFIGTKTGPYSYYEHGKYVDMTFYHLVSKIKIGTFQLTEASGAIQRDLKAEMTFINMPTTATFYPHPTDDDILNKPYCRDGMPVVVPDPGDLNGGITYFISNQAEAVNADIFYICPEIDFSTVEYQIKLVTKGYEDYDTYYGTFDAVNFVRNNQDYDYPDGSDTKILHAGEMMTININLVPGVGPGLALVIDKWNTEKMQDDATYHTYPGIYTEEEMNDLRSLFLQLRGADDQKILDQLKAIFYLYGHTNDAGQNVLELYDNLNLLSYPSANIFPIWKDYILDGLGHTVIMKTNNGNPGGQFGGNYPYYNIGPCRNIYFTDGDGKNTIYIDDEGYVWVTSKITGELERTQNQLQDLQGYNSYDINAETGQIRYSTYFNDYITG